MKTYEEYFTNVNTIVKRIFETQGTRIEQVAEMVSDAISKDGLVHVLGVGHSHIIAEEVFWRAGTLVPIHAILEPSMIGHSEITKSAYMEKLEGTGKIICDYHRILPPDILIAISNSGNNSMPIDVAIEAKKRGVKTIGICSFTYTKSLKPRHSSGKKLMDVVDVSIDNCGQVGDTCIKLEGIEQGLGPTSTISGVYIINSITIQAAANLHHKGIQPLVYWSGNLPDGMQANKEYMDKYWERIRNL